MVLQEIRQHFLVCLSLQIFKREQLSKFCFYLHLPIQGILRCLEQYVCHSLRPPIHSNQGNPFLFSKGQQLRD